jgi:hypothetical protein
MTRGPCEYSFFCFMVISNELLDLCMYNFGMEIYRKHAYSL